MLTIPGPDRNQVDGRIIRQSAEGVACNVIDPDVRGVTGPDDVERDVLAVWGYTWPAVRSRRQVDGFFMALPSNPTERPRRGPRLVTRQESESSFPSDGEHGLAE